MDYRDGTVVVGKVRTASGQWHAGRWVAGTGWSDLGTLGGSHSETAGVSANGKQEMNSWGRRCGRTIAPLVRQ